MYFEKEKYSETIKSYKKLRDWYLFSSHAKKAGLIIADAHYRRGKRGYAASAEKAHGGKGPRKARARTASETSDDCMIMYLQQLKT